MAESSSLKIVNISVKNAVMPKEFYWKTLQIDRLNEAFSKHPPHQTQNFQIFAPKMPLSSPPLCVTLHVRNCSDTEIDLTTTKQSVCECLLKKNRVRKAGEHPHRCVHRDVADMRPGSLRIQPGSIKQLEMTLSYALLGQQAVDFTVVSTSFDIKLRVSVEALEFDPSTLLMTNQLAPVAINLYPAPLQVLWLHNPFSTDIKLRLISGHARLTIMVDEIVVKSHEHSPLVLTFSPNYVGSYELQIEIVFNECRNLLPIYGECIGRESDLLDCSTLFRHRSPSSGLNSPINPFVLHGDNLCIAVLRESICSENLIGLQNNSKSCIKFVWDDVKIALDAVEVFVEPKSGYLKSGCMKLFRVSVKSLGSNALLQMIPVKCSIFQYHDTKFREYTLPDGYFEFTVKGFYEKPSDWTPKSTTLLQSLYVNVNIRTVTVPEIIKNVTSSGSRESGKHLMLQCLTSGQLDKLDDLPSLADDEPRVLKPKCKLHGNDDIQRIRNALVSLMLEGSEIDGKQKNHSHEEHYATLGKARAPKSDMNSEQESLIPKLMNDVLFECIAEISKERRFIPPSW